MVTMARLNLVQKWFGDFFTPAQTSVITEMVNLQKEAWFMQDVSRLVADQYLASREDGYFLVRLSSNNPQVEPFTISKRKAGATVHRRVGRLSYEVGKQGRYSVQTGTSSFVEGATMPDVIARLRLSHSVRHVCPREGVGSVYANTANRPFAATAAAAATGSPTHAHGHAAAAAATSPGASPQPSAPTGV
eukprot:TRINITY_DN2702_c0_g4_i1.p2 TRINITY_DN2702_c0_g4~~TRINITY_DN2702_c0_g4_i1.p2  ORF type:complete len:190 (+),score=76.85 TRINITY_DN2702_c0_g4_i1:86-655(+)